MLNKNLFIKRFNKLLLSINKLIESFFNTFQNFNVIGKNKKNNLKNVNKKFVLILGGLFVTFLSYFLIPSFYDEELVKNKLKDQIFQKYNIQVRFDKSLNYGLLPKPHFLSNKTLIDYNNSSIGESNNNRIYISTKNLFSLKNLEIKDLDFKKTKFNIDSKSVNFFREISLSEKSNESVNFKKSILFYNNKKNEVMFILDINDLKFSFNEEFINQVSAKYKIFNVPFKLNVKNDLINKKISTKLKSKRIRLNIENDLDYSKKNLEGLVTFKVINNSKIFNYKISNNNLDYNSEDGNFNGNLAFKPFYFISNSSFEQLDIKKILDNNSILLNLLDSEILYNPNLNAQINVNFNKIKGSNYLENLVLKTFLEEGNIITKSSSVNWNDSIMMNLNDIQLINEKNELKLSGAITFDFKDIVKFYSHYQIKRNYRKNIKKVSVDFLFNLNEKKIQLENLRIDGKSSEEIDNFVNNINIKQINFFNKVLFKNLIRDFFVKYQEG